MYRHFTTLFMLLSFSFFSISGELPKIHHSDIFGGRVANIEKAIVNGANVNSEVSFGITPLEYALIDCNADIVSLLIRYGAEVNLINELGATPIFLACDEATIELLTDAGANVNFRTYDGYTPLHSALFRRNDYVALKLIERGADVNVLSPEGTSPLHMLRQRKSSYWGDLEKLIIAKGGKDISTRGSTELSGRRRTNSRDVDCEDTRSGGSVNSPECELSEEQGTADDSSVR